MTAGQFRARLRSCAVTTVRVTSRFAYDQRVSLRRSWQLLRAAIVALVALTSMHARAQRGPVPARDSDEAAERPELWPRTAQSRRMLVVVTDDWSATTGTMQRFERAAPRTPWWVIGEPIPVVLGKGGLGWGVGMMPRPAGTDGPEKREGDGRSPAGVFYLGDITGYDDAPSPPPPRLELAYRRATPALRCVDDPTAPHYYNRLVDAPDGVPPWKSAEKMRRDDELYRFTVFVRHNEQRVPGRGSCVFLHVWRGPSMPTVGCTAMPLATLRQLMFWLDRDTLLVQLPRATYEKLQRDWWLPPLVNLIDQR